MLEKRRTLELSHSINSWLFVFFLLFYAVLFSSGFIKANSTLVSFLYNATLFLNVLYIVHSLFVFVLAIAVHISDKVGSHKIVWATIFKLLFAIILMITALLLKEMLLLGV